MRHVLQPHGVHERHQQPGLEPEDLHVARERPDLAPQLRVDIERRAVERVGVLAEHDAIAGEHGADRRQDVVEDRVVGQRTVQRAAQRVDRTGRAERRADAALEPPQLFFVAPVQAHAVGDARRETAAAIDRRAPSRAAVVANAAVAEDAAAFRARAPPGHFRRLAVEEQLARHAADARIGERRDQPAHGVGREHLPRVGEDQDVVHRARDAGVERRRLAARRNRDDVDRVAEWREHAQRVVGRSVGDDDDLPFAGGIVEREEILDARAQPECFVARRDDDRHAGFDPTLRCAVLRA